MKIILDYWEGADVESANVQDELRRVAYMLGEGYTSGELTAGEGSGWWSIEDDD